ncbi:hypothetical protein K7H13_06335 [Qipengyuania citrea]|uniref:hypothetical protein n=1 Tax=Qipengyuania citrea TaxID=225971 RepID=UPI001E3EE787|nr:hypothetical protein [Qipengyuania citrea]MCD1590375.1 hypothetical protein [Qipengyuania citrea]
MTSCADIERWSGAMVAFDYCDPKPLSDLVASEPVPDKLRPVIAAIISGERKPDKRKAAHSKVDAAERFRAGAVLAAVLNTIDDMNHPAITGPAADRMGIEPRQAIDRLNMYRERAYQVVEDAFGVSRETVENLARDYRKKVRNWPDV